MNTTTRNYLIETARNRTNQTITYQELSNKCNLGLQMENPGDRIKIADILDGISIFEHSHGRPLLSALVMRAGDSTQGDGFFKLAERVGNGNWQSLKRDEVFSANEITNCIEYWTNEEHYRNFRTI